MRHAAFFQGYDDFLRGLAEDENPKCSGTPAFWAWREGWEWALKGHKRPPEPTPPLPERRSFE